MAVFQSLRYTTVSSVVLMIWLGMAAVTAAAAQDLADRVAALAEGGFNDKVTAVGALAATGDDRAAPVLEAMLEGLLFTQREGGSIVIGEHLSRRELRLADAVTGADLGTAGSRSVRKIRINNRVRAAIRSALGGLKLMHPDPAERRAAAAAVLNAPDLSFLPTLDTAIDRETEPDLKTLLGKARAAVLLSSETVADRLEAVRYLGTYTDPEVRGLLGGLLVERGGRQAEPDDAVRAAAAEAIADIDRRLQQWAIVGNIYQGISLGSVLLLAAIGLAITFGVMGVINMAHGEMVMLGAYATFVTQELFRAYWPGYFGWSLAVAIPFAFLVTALVGMAIERGIIRFLYGRPLETLLATWGLSLILQQAVRTIFGPTNREVGTPDWMQGAIETTAGLTLTYNRLYIILFSLIVLFALMLVLRHTALGLQMRAVTQNRPMAAGMGIPTGRVDMLTFGLGSGIAGIGGVALSQIDNVSPNLGQSYIVDSFMVVVFGGVGNLWGTLAGAMSLGVINKLLEPYAGAVLAKILVLVAIILFIQKRPRGLFALKGRAVEA